MNERENSGGRTDDRGVALFALLDQEINQIPSDEHIQVDGHLARTETEWEVSFSLNF